MLSKTLVDGLHGYGIGAKDSSALRDNTAGHAAGPHGTIAFHWTS
jgi:hypothetical protein